MHLFPGVHRELSDKLLGDLRDKLTDPGDSFLPGLIELIPHYGRADGGVKVKLGFPGPGRGVLMVHGFVGVNGTLIELRHDYLVWVMGK
jgi:hypothetical protein